jgi:hypothetical protein
MKGKIRWWSLQRMKIIKKTRWLKIKGENAWANAFKMITQTLDQKYKKKRMKLVKES